MTNTLSEAESKRLLSKYEFPFAPEREVTSSDEAVKAARELGYPVVAKLCGEGISHKSERGLVLVGMKDDDEVARATKELLAAAGPDDGEVSVLLAPVIPGSRELIVGLHRDGQLGMVVMLGIGGIFAEVLGDVTFRVAPITTVDAQDMIDELASRAMLDSFRGQAPVDMDALVKLLCDTSRLGLSESDLQSAECNPVMITPSGSLVGVDALVVKEESSTGDQTDKSTATLKRSDPKKLDALFSPRGVIVAGASSHPGKFGFVALHNILASGYEGNVFATNRDGSQVLGIDCMTSIDDIPSGTADLVVLCTPASANLDLLRSCAAKGVRAAFVASAGYGESDDAGRIAEDELVKLAGELDVALAGPNGQGLVSTPARLCAQIVAPYPPRGRIGIASQSGNLVSSFMNLASQSGVGISRAVSAGNAAALEVIDYLEYFAWDDETDVGLAYMEGFAAGPPGVERLREVAANMPLVVLTGGTSPAGRKAAVSHTGSLAADDKVFAGLCRQLGVVHAITMEEAYEAAATLASQPLPRGPRVAVVTTAGGWGVLSADAISRSSLELVDIPSDLSASIDDLLPPRWSRSNPIDLAGGETRDTVPEVLRLVASHSDIDSVIFLGLGIQSNQAHLMRGGPFYPDHGIERIVAYHERQDVRYAEAAKAVSEEFGKPVMVATELSLVRPDSPGVKAVRDTGRLCYASSHRAVIALDHLWARSRWLQRRFG